MSQSAAPPRSFGEGRIKPPEGDGDRIESLLGLARILEESGGTRDREAVEAR